MDKRMNDFNPPVQSLKSLLIATALATLLAAVILVTAVLPAEYGIDPTGLGKNLGLTTLLVVPAHSGLEYKFQLVKGATLDYAWKTDGTKLYFDFHGEPKGDKTGYFKSFQVSTDNQANGALIAPFEGIHGWYWENKTTAPITILLNTKGSYQIVGLM
jgi:hypothetical protein